MVKLGVVAPVLVENEKKLLCSPESKDGQEDSASAFHDVLDEC